MKKTVLMKNFIALMLFVLMSVYAMATFTVTITAPSSNSNINGTYNFTATLSGHGNADNVSYCTFSTTTDGVFGNSTLGNITSYHNQTNTASLTETASTTITVSCYNYTGTLLGSGTSTGVGIDNTNPSCSCTLDTNIIELYNQLGYDCIGSSDTTTITYSCVATYEDSNTETETDQLGYFEETYSLGEGSVTCTVTDEVNKTNSCSAITFTVEGDGVGRGTKTTAGIDLSDKKTKKTVIGIFAVIIVVIVIISITIYISKEGKRKR